MQKYFRFFFWYSLFAIVAELVKFLLFEPGKNTWPYFWAAWGSEAIYAILGFLAIYEVFRHVFENFHHLRWFKFLLPITVALMLAIAILIPLVHRAVDTEPPRQPEDLEVIHSPPLHALPKMRTGPPRGPFRVVRAPATPRTTCRIHSSTSHWG